MPTDWIEFVVEIAEEAEEAACALLFSVGCAGTSLERDTQGIRVKGYVPASDDAGEKATKLWNGLDRIREAGLDCGPAQVLVNLVDEEDWAEAWRKHFHPLEVGRTWLINPTWESLPETTDRIVIELDPGMAFGSGTHPTTQLCLMMLEDVIAEKPRASDPLVVTCHAPSPKRLWRVGDSPLATPCETIGLDLGCGSGILSIAMAKAGLMHILAIDHDRIAVQVAEENVRLNAVADRVEVTQCDLGHFPMDRDRLFARRGTGACEADIVMANLTSQTILDHCLILRRCVAPKGVLIASGINVERADEVAAALRKSGLTVQKVLTHGEWSGLLARS